MGKFEYLNKRDENGVLLRYSAIELSYEKTQISIKILRNNPVYKILSSSLPEIYLDLYYKKLIFESFLPIAHQLVIYNHDILKNINSKSRKINIFDFPCNELLEIIWSDKKIGFYASNFKKNKIFLKTKNVLKNIRKIYYRKNFFKVNSTEKFHQKFDEVRIAVSLQEGFDIQKRSDLFWFFGSDINPKSVIVYFENKNDLIQFDNLESTENFFKKTGISTIKLWEVSNKKRIDKYIKLAEKVKLIKTHDKISTWIKNSAQALCLGSSFWSNFFKENGITIHMDCKETGLETIIKQIAIRDLGGCSVGKLRSYPTSIKGDFLGFYPNDTFFCWGNDSAKKIKKNNPHIQNIIISSFPYISSYQKKNKGDIKVKFKMFKKKTKFNILLLDSNSDKNNGLLQVIDSYSMINFYQTLLSWVENDEDLGLIIKPKKIQFLKKLESVYSQIDYITNQLGRCKLVKNSFQKFPHYFLDGIDMVVGTGTFMPSAVLECAIHGTRSIIYDYSNLCFVEKEIFSKGKNKIVFTELDKMLNQLKIFKNNQSSVPYLGDWSNILKELNHNYDNGGDLIGKYIYSLKEGFEKGYNRKKVIEISNRIFSKKWGSDKIYCSE